jgi:arsenate reductase-like glutaredoxin family protein
MNSSTASLDRIRELLEEMRIQSEIGDRVREDAIRRYNEAEKRKQAAYARIRAEQERLSRPLLTRIREAVFG